MTRRIAPAGDDANDRLLTLPELAIVFRVPMGKISRLIRAGKIRPVKPEGGDSLFLESEVRAVLGSRRVRPS